MLEAQGFVTGLDNVAVMRELVQQGRGHLRVAEDAEDAELIVDEHVISRQVLDCIPAAVKAIESRPEYIPAVRAGLTSAEAFYMLLDRMVVGEGCGDRKSRSATCKVVSVQTFAAADPRQLSWISRPSLNVERPLRGAHLGNFEVPYPLQSGLCLWPRATLHPSTQGAQTSVTHRDCAEVKGKRLDESSIASSGTSTADQAYVAQVSSSHLL